MALDIGDLLGKGVVATSLDVDNALYATSAAQAVDEKEQKSLIFWAHIAEYLARLGLLAIGLYVLSGDEKLFTLFGVEFTPTMVALLIAGSYLLISNVADLDNFLVGKGDGDQKVEKMPFTRALFEMTLVNTVLSIDTVVAVADQSDVFLGVAIILSVSTVIRLLFLQQIAGFMRDHPDATIITSSFLILVGVSLLLQGVGVEFPEEGFGVGLAIAFVVLMVYRKYGPAFFRGEDAPSRPAEPVEDATTDAEMADSTR